MGKPVAFRNRLRKAVKDTAGATIVYFALMLPILFGFIGLASDIAMFHMHSRSVNMMTDSAAFSTALEVMRSSDLMNGLVTISNPTPDDIRAARAPVLTPIAMAQAQQNGFSLLNGDTIEVYSPPRSGPRMDDPKAVEVVISRRAPVFFSALVGGQDATVTDRAVAVRGATNCVISLNETDNDVITASGTANATFPCGLHANSSGTSAVSTSGFGAQINAPSIDVVGGYSGIGLNPTPSTNAQVQDDPFADIGSLIPDYSAECIVSLPSVSQAETDPTFVIDPVTTQADYGCGADGNNIIVFAPDLSLGSQSHVHFNPGVYVLTGDFTVGAQVQADGQEVTFIFQDGRITVGGGASLRISAPTVGPLAGLLLIQDPNYTGTQDPHSHQLGGGSSQLLDGVVYFPNSTIKFSGGSSTEKTATMLIADKVAFTGNTYLASPMDGAAGSTMALIKGLQALLVE